MNPQKLIPYFERAQWLVHQQTKGLTHEESLLRVGTWNNHMNWVIGHMVHYRGMILETLGHEAGVNKAALEPYVRESEPLTDESKAVQLRDLLSAFDQTHEALVDALKAATAEQMATIHDEERNVTLGERIEFLQWHETYHVGQLEILRQLAETADAII